MADPLQELLRSPLDDMPDSRIQRRSLQIVTVALLFGFATGWFAWTPDNPAQTDVTGSTTPMAEPLDLPPGYVDTGRGYAIGASWMFTRGNDLIIGISVAHRAGDATVDSGATTLGFDRRGMGVWTVELSGGQRVDNTREFFDTTAPGVVTVEFEDIDATVDDVVGLAMRPSIGAGTRVHQVNLDLNGLPAAFDSIAPLAVTERIESTVDGTARTDLTWISIENLTVDWGNAAVSWSMNDAPNVRAMVQIGISLEGDTPDEIQLQTISGGRAFLQRPQPPVSPAVSGVAVLRKVSGATRESYVPDRALAAFTVSWLRYGNTSLPIPLDTITRLDAIE